MKDEAMIERFSQESTVQISGPAGFGPWISGSGIIGDVIGLETTLNLKQVD